MKFQAVKGTRDFYPDEMRLRNYICDAWRRVSLRNGFEEYDAPIFEYLDLFTIKSGQEIAEQLFSLTDRGGRDLAIRPEITPSLARMVNAKINALPRPIKWFSIPRLCRAENPQKGRLREFFQWNVDVIGSDDVLADAECIYVCADFLREIGLTPGDVQIRIGSRAMAMSRLKAAGVADNQMDQVLLLIDKRPKASDEELKDLCCDRMGLPESMLDLVNTFEKEAQQAAGGQGPDLSDFPLDDEQVAGPIRQLADLFDDMNKMGVGDYCTYDPRIVRGLAYYTGIVYEVFDAGESLRAIAGGGRYDNLLEVLGGPSVGATGFGMGDVVLGILLEEKGKRPAMAAALDYFVIDQDVPPARLLEVVGRLRSAGRSADFSYTRRSAGKQLKEANKRGAAKALFVRPDGLSAKDLATGEQQDVTLETLLLQPGAATAE